MPISSGAAGRRLGRDGARPAASIASARSTPNLAQPAPAPAAQSAQGRTGRRMIDAPPRVETRRRLGSQTLYGSRPPWATDEDAPSPKKEQQTPTTPQQQDQQQQPPFYPAGGDLLHGEAARMRRIKAARELYKSPHSRRKHNTGSVDDLLRDCAVSDHSHSPSPVRRTPSAASSVNRSTTDLQAQKERPASRPGPSTRSTGVGTTDGASSGSPLRRRQRKEESIESDDSLDDGERRRKGVTGDSHGSRQRQSRTSRGTSPPPPEKPLYVDTGCDALDWGASKSPSTRQSFGRSKMAPGLKPAAERKYVPPPPVRQPSPSVKKHDCLPSDRPAFKARPMPDFRRVSPSPGRSNRSRSQSPARRAAPAQTSSATTSGYRSGGGGSSPPGRRDHQSRRRSMDEDSLTEASSAGPGDRSVATEVLQPQKAPAPEDRRAAAADAMDSGFRSLEPEAAMQQRSRGSGRSSLLLVPEKVLKDRSVTDIDLDEIFGTNGQPLQQPRRQQRQAPMQSYSQTTDAVDNNGEVNERIQYWLKRNIYFHACDSAPDWQSQQQDQQSKYATSPPNSETLRSMSEHRPQQPRMEILVQRTDVQQVPVANDGRPPRHVSTVEYPVRKFQQLPYGYLSPSSSEDDVEDGDEDVSRSPQNSGAEIVRQAVVYARSTAADSGFWFSTENGGAPRSLGTAYNAAPAQPRPGSAASSSGASSRAGGRVRALASRFNQQQPTAANGDFVSSYQQPVTPARSQTVRNGHAANNAPAFSSQLRRVTPGQPSAASSASASAATDSKTFYFGDSDLVSKREQREHWASGYFNRPKIEIIDRSGGQ